MTKRIIFRPYIISFNYYLGYFAYPVSDVDCSKSDSLTAPYKAKARITENQYIEAEHSSTPSQISPYLYTVSKPITLNFEYRTEDFRVSSVEYGSPSIDQGWPQEVLKNSNLLRKE